MELNYSLKGQEEFYEWVKTHEDYIESLKDGKEKEELRNLLKDTIGRFEADEKTYESLKETGKRLCEIYEENEENEKTSKKLKRTISNTNKNLGTITRNKICDPKFN